LGNLEENASAFFDIEEETHAIYAQANFEFGIVRGNFGLRYVDTDITSFGNTVIGGVATPIVTESGYDEWLPRLNISADLTNDLVLRASWTEDIQRPDFGDLSTSVSFGTSPNAPVNIGNPDLGPESFTSFDVSLDWYFAPAAVFSIAFFHKDRDDVFVTQLEDAFEDPITGFRDITDPCEQGGIFNPVPDRNVLSDVIGNGLCVPIQTIINDTSSTTQTGVELAFQYDLSNWEDRLGWASGFGLVANYTFQDFGGGEATNGSSGRGQEIFEAINPNIGGVEAVQGLLDFSRNSFNVTGFYEKYGLSARARYTWRDAFRTLDTAGGASLNSTFGFPVVTEPRGQLNASVNYNGTERLNVGVEAINLLQNNITQSCVNSGALTCFQGLPDRRIVFGATYTF
jgi:TonB-dependent receptor